MDVDIDVSHRIDSRRTAVRRDGTSRTSVVDSAPLVTGDATRRALERVLAHRDVCFARAALPALRCGRARRDGHSARRRRCRRARAGSGIAARRRACRRGNPRYGHLIARAAAEHAVFEAVRKRRRRRRAADRADRLLELRQPAQARALSANSSRRSTGSRLRRARSKRRSSPATSACTTNVESAKRFRLRRSLRASARFPTSRNVVTMPLKARRVRCCTWSAIRRRRSADRC